jgi:hypothetical protein
VVDIPLLLLIHVTGADSCWSQDDFLDYYGDPKFIGKIGTDILDNKCSWLINKALQIATPEQRAILDVYPPLYALISLIPLSPVITCPQPPWFPAAKSQYDC